MKKLLFTIISILVALVLFAGCAATTVETTATTAGTTTAGTTTAGTTTAATTTAAKEIKIFNNYCHKTAEVCVQWYWGSIQAGKELGVQVDGNADENAALEANVAMVEQAIASGYDGLAIMAYISDGFTPIIDKAMDMGIPVMTYHSDAPQSKRIAYFGPNQKEYAENAAAFTAKFLGNEGKAITVQGSTSDTEAMVLNYFKDALEKNSNVKVVVQLNDTLDPAKAYEKITAAAQSNKDVKAYFSSTMRGGSDVAKVLTELGLLDDKTCIITMDVVSENVELLKEGKIAGLVDQGALESGYMAVKALVDYINNGKLTEYKTGENFMAGTIVGKDNVAPFAEKVKAVQEFMKAGY